ncbi:dTDP-4-amino-4,6-dideoxygalactose transaminase [Haloflavibacter putidus]|uniref:dTDP-4-amino-4,6-dideoxygalactose transaminase n=1 Tax=Haloflavibacter putidus TaxID=2576776 RepID=A0A507Z9R3_9FLAO|nr:dTDP-4-amino-4,6-dideoxygalactose transaminase [Haloflavibacter putidus]TQD33799.1 dTDP-4-amino-4,6-dideoxygalactose transaminase [Haloflavibacter putidus]
MIPFNKPFQSGKEINYLQQVLAVNKLAGNGVFTEQVQAYFEQHYNLKKAFLTTSCTDALEMAALLIEASPEDEIIMPSYTFVSTALAFDRQGAKVIFADVKKEFPNLSVAAVAEKITPRTKAIVVVHYAGVPVDMDGIMALAKKHNLYVIEDCAHAIGVKQEAGYLGSIGHLSTFSFHETKNISSGEGGILGINDPIFVKRAEMIWEKGTNRAAFFRGETTAYNWNDTGSSFMPAEFIAAVLLAQLPEIKKVNQKRLDLWNYYYQKLEVLQKENKIKLPQLPQNTPHNAHIFYLLCSSANERNDLIAFLKEKKIHSVFHYLGLHTSPYYLKNNPQQSLPNTEYFASCLLRLPLYYGLSQAEQDQVIEAIFEFYE